MLKRINNFIWNNKQSFEVGAFFMVCLALLIFVLAALSHWPLKGHLIYIGIFIACAGILLDSKVT